MSSCLLELYTEAAYIRSIALLFLFDVYVFFLHGRVLCMCIDKNAFWLLKAAKTTITLKFNTMETSRNKYSIGTNLNNEFTIILTKQVVFVSYR